MRFLRLWRGWISILMILLAAVLAILPSIWAKGWAAILFTTLIVLVLGGAFNDWDQVARKDAFDPEPLPPRCNVCGYDLRASKQRCPECGTPIPPAEGFLIMTPMANRIIERAEAIARESDLEHFGSEHLLAAMFSEPESVAAKMLDDFGIEESEVLGFIEEMDIRALPNDSSVT